MDAHPSTTGSSCRRIQRDDTWAHLWVVLSALTAYLLAGAIAYANPVPAELERIAFGSCARHDAPQPIWWTILGHRPDLFILTGDNVYADTADDHLMRSAYRSLAAKPGFKALRQQVPLLATWDDHDYGQSDGGPESTTPRVSDHPGAGSRSSFSTRGTFAVRSNGAGTTTSPIRIRHRLCLAASSGSGCRKD